jgi:N-methylhydantoinase B/oxoprolinase/acetone carboxylase alpha subunit
MHPGPSVGGNTDLQPKLIDLLLAAFAKAVPDRVAAATGGSSSNLLFGGTHPDTGRYYSNYNFDGHGTGATAIKDGNDGEVTRHSNCRNTPIEVFEHRYPLLTKRYGLARDSGGAGEHRGGLATERVIRVTAPEITFSALFDRCKLGAPGLFGGHEGGRTLLMVKLKGTDEFRTFPEVFGVKSPTKFTNVVLHEGDELYYRTPGGAGFGPPAKRDPALIREDLLEGYISPAAAARDYGFKARDEAAE